MDYKDKIVTNLFVSKSSNKVIARIYKGSYTKSDILNVVKKFQEKYSNKKLHIMLSINTPFGFRSGKQFGINEEPILVDEYDADYDNTNAFIIYCWKRDEQIMGSNEKNSCLFDCIERVLSKFRLPKNIKCDADLKKCLHISENEKIPMSKLPIVEKLFQANINVTGEYNYTSPHKYKRTINLIMSNEHVELNNNIDNCASLIKHLPFKEQQLVLVKVNTETDEVACYNGAKFFTINTKEYNKRKCDLFGDEVYLEKIPLPKSDDLKADHENYMNEINKLRDLTNGRIDLTKSGYKIVNEALKCIHFSLRAYDEPEPITQQEQEWIMNTFTGGLIFSEKCSLKNAFCYDKNSAYPSMLCDDHFTFPVTQGSFTLMKELPTVLGYGIYRCFIKHCDNPNVNKLFRFNNKNFYTHFDINLARSLNLEISLLNDKQANALLYAAGRANGAQYFRQIVHSLFELKQKSKLAKHILNAIWGALSQRNKITKSTVDPIYLIDNERIINIVETGDDIWKVTYLQHHKYFKYSYGRLGCFLTSAVRSNMAKTIFPYKENVFRCHTDSILSNIPIDELQIGTYLHEFKLEKTGSVQIINSNKTIWN